MILDIDTPGGRLDAVLQMRDALLGSPVRTIAFVDRTAFSAGALIAIAAEEIYMTPGAVMGAATPVDGVTGETASEKIVSAVRTTFKATAEARGRDPLGGGSDGRPGCRHRRSRVARRVADPDDERGDRLGLQRRRRGQPHRCVGGGRAGGRPQSSSRRRVWPSAFVRFITDPALSTLLISGARAPAHRRLLRRRIRYRGRGRAGPTGALLLGAFPCRSRRLGGRGPRCPRAPADRRRDHRRAGIRHLRRTGSGGPARRPIPGDARPRNPDPRRDRDRRPRPSWRR